MQLPELKSSVTHLEDAIITLSGPCLAVSSVLAIVDLLTGGHILQQYAWFSLAWALCLALTLDFQILALGARTHQIYLSEKKPGRKAVEIGLCILIAVSIAFVSVQMQSIIARVNSFSGMTVEQAASQLGINTIWLIWERSALVLAMIFLSGWFREVKAQAEQDAVPSVSSGTNPSISEETMQLLLERLAKVDQLEQEVAQQKVTIIEEISKPLALPVPSAETRLNIAPMRIKPTQPIYNVLDKIDGLPTALSSTIPFVPLSTGNGTEDDEKAIQAHIVEVLTETPDIKVRELAAIVERPQTTVYRHMVQVKKQMEQMEQNGKGE